MTAIVARPGGFSDEPATSAWIDDQQVIEQELAEHRISIRMEVQPCVPLGISTWNTAAALRNISMRGSGC